MSSRLNSSGVGSTDPAEDPVDDETRDAYGTALTEVIHLTFDVVSAASRVMSLRQSLSSAVARLRALVEAMPQEAQRTRDAKAEFVAVLAVIEDRLDTRFDFSSAARGVRRDRPDDQRPYEKVPDPGPRGNDDDN